MRALSDGRIRRSKSEWRAIAREFESSGFSQVAFCRKVGVARQRFRIWRERLTAQLRQVTDTRQLRARIARGTRAGRSSCHRSARSR